MNNLKLKDRVSVYLDYIWLGGKIGKITKISIFKNETKKFTIITDKDKEEIVCHEDKIIKLRPSWVKIIHLGLMILVVILEFILLVRGFCNLDLMSYAVAFLPIFLPIVGSACFIYKEDSLIKKGGE